MLQKIIFFFLQSAHVQIGVLKNAHFVRTNYILSPYLCSVFKNYGLGNLISFEGLSIKFPKPPEYKTFLLPTVIRITKIIF